MIENAKILHLKNKYKCKNVISLNGVMNLSNGFLHHTKRHVLYHTVVPPNLLYLCIP